MYRNKKFDELDFFANVKTNPGVYLGEPSLLSLRDQLFGMNYAFSFHCDETPLKYYCGFVNWYNDEFIKDKNGYACWWNHLLYTSGNNDRVAFERHFVIFEKYLRQVHNLSLGV